MPLFLFIWPSSPFPCGGATKPYDAISLCLGTRYEKVVPTLNEVAAGIPPDPSKFQRHPAIGGENLQPIECLHSQWRLSNQLFRLNQWTLFWLHGSIPDGNEKRIRYEVLKIRKGDPFHGKTSIPWCGTLKFTLICCPAMDHVRSEFDQLGQ
jgi:hypothetical protein